MKFTVLDTQAAYRQLLAAPDAASREAIFRQELLRPFEGLTQIMGGSDPLAMFRQWGMTPEQFDGEQGQQMVHHLETLAAADARTKAAQALNDGAAAFAAYADRIELQEVTFGLLRCDMGSVPLQRGYSGFGAWLVFGLVCYAVYSELNMPWPTQNLIGGGALVVAALYAITPMKRAS